MRHFAFYIGTGEILSSTSCSDAIEPTPPPGQMMLETMEHIDPNTHYVVRGAVARKPQKPAHWSKFSCETGRWMPDEDAAWRDVRARRDALIASSDWTMLPDVQMTPERRAGWSLYRQALRDVTKQKSPFSITWPAPPG